MILNGKEVALSLLNDLKNEYDKLINKPTLAILSCLDDASKSYLKGRIKAAETLNANIKLIDLNEYDSNEKVEILINKLNKDCSIHGIMIDRPLDKRFNENYLLNLIDSKKDVDGFTSNNIGNLTIGNDCFYPATAKAAIEIVKYYNIPIASKNILVIGRSINVGKPLALMLLKENATVTIAHSKTTNLQEKCNNADIIFVAIGKANFINKDYVNKKTIIVDIGINYNSDGKLCGDVDKDVYDLVDSYSPVPGGVGAITNAILFTNLLKAYNNSL